MSLSRGVHVLKYFLLFAIICGSVSAHAIRDNEYFWQAKSKELYFEGALGFVSLKTAYQYVPVTDQYIKQKGVVYFAAAEYGVSENIAIRLGTSFRSQTVEYYPSSKYKYQGLGDIDVGAKLTSELDNYNIRYGANVTFSPGDSEYKNNSLNNYSGRNFFIPYIGFDFDATNLTYGLRISYALPMSDQKRVINDVPEQRTGGEMATLSLFSERHLPREGNIGLKFNYYMNSDYESPTGREENPDAFSLSAYGNGFRTASLMFTYDVGYYSAKKTEVLEKKKGIVGFLGLRYKF